MVLGMTGSTFWSLDLTHFQGISSTLRKCKHVICKPLQMKLIRTDFEMYIPDIYVYIPKCRQDRAQGRIVVKGKKKRLKLREIHFFFVFSLSPLLHVPVFCHSVLTYLPTNSNSASSILKSDPCESIFQSQSKLRRQANLLSPFYKKEKIIRLREI